MMNFAAAGLLDLLSPQGHECACGRRHATGLRDLRVGAGVLEQLPQALAALGLGRPFVVCDGNTYRVAGERVMGILEGAGLRARLHVFADVGAKMEPDERMMGSLVMGFTPECDGVLAVGSGVITDCCKVLAHAAGRPLVAVATAPSMDGYASNSSSMIRDRVKVTLYNGSPLAILADTDILRAAPMRMLQAGLGDMLAKHVSLCEWRIASLVTGEYYCENVAGLVRASLRACVAAADGLVRREPAAVEAVVRGLILSGVAMSFAQVSRPASGLEHYFSHMWEMMALARGEPCDLHGIQVGVGTALTIPLLWRVREIQPDRARAQAAMAGFSSAAWEAETKDIFGPAARTVIAQEKREGKNDPIRHAQRLDRLLAHWEDIRAVIAQELPRPEEVDGLMERLSMPRTPADLGVSARDTRNAFIGSRSIRDKYLTSSLLWDLGLLHALAPGLAEGGGCALP